MQKVALYDTTLRDGTQSPGINLSLADKLRVTKLLDGLGIHVIEGGWPGSNPKDAEYFVGVRKLGLRQAKIAAFGSTRRKGIATKDDENLNALVAAKPDVITIFGKTSSLHVESVLRVARKEGIAMISDSIAFLKSKKFTVYFDCEHFFDGWKLDKAFTLDCLSAAEQAGADMIIPCDTNGGTLPWEVQEIFEALQAEIKTPLGIHAHDDSGTGVANSLSAVRAGAVQVQGTMNGYGERVGNANLCTVIPDLQLKMGRKVLSSKQLSRLTAVSHEIAEIANQAPPRFNPFVGVESFTHKGGIHVSGIQRVKSAYEHVDPALVGNESGVVISDLAGKSNVLFKAKQFRLVVDPDDARLREVLKQIKVAEHEGYSFEGADASFELFLRMLLAEYRRPFELIKYMTIVGKDSENRIEAMVKLMVEGVEMHTAASGNGPVNAMDKAFRKALLPHFKSLSRVSLIDYKVRIVDTDSATAAKTRVLITSTDGKREWTTVGASTNIIEASWQALSDAIAYALLK